MRKKIVISLISLMAIVLVGNSVFARSSTSTSSPTEDYNPIYDRDWETNQITGVITGTKSSPIDTQVGTITDEGLNNQTAIVRNKATDTLKDSKDFSKSMAEIEINKAYSMNQNERDRYLEILKKYNVIDNGEPSSTFINTETVGIQLREDGNFTLPEKELKEKLFQTIKEGKATRVTSQKITVNPNKIPTDQKETLAKACNETLGLNYDAVLNKLNTNSESEEILPAGTDKQLEVSHFKEWLTEWEYTVGNTSEMVQIQEIKRDFMLADLTDYILEDYLPYRAYNVIYHYDNLAGTQYAEYIYAHVFDAVYLKPDVLKNVVNNMNSTYVTNISKFNYGAKKDSYGNIKSVSRSTILNDILNRNKTIYTIQLGLNYNFKLIDLTDEGIWWVIDNIMYPMTNIASDNSHITNNPNYMGNKVSVSESNSEFTQMVEQRQVTAEYDNIVKDIASKAKEDYITAKNNVVEKIKIKTRESAQKYNVNISEENINKMGNTILSYYTSDAAYEQHVKDLLYEAELDELYTLYSSDSLANLNAGNSSVPAISPLATEAEKQKLKEAAELSVYKYLSNEQNHSNYAGLDNVNFLTQLQNDSALNNCYDLIDGGFKEFKEKNGQINEYSFNFENWDLTKKVGTTIKNSESNKNLTKTDTWEILAKRAAAEYAFGTVTNKVNELLTSSGFLSELKKGFKDLGPVGNSLEQIVDSAIDLGLQSILQPIKEGLYNAIGVNISSAAKQATQNAINSAVENATNAIQDEALAGFVKSQKSAETFFQKQFYQLKENVADAGSKLAAQYTKELLDKFGMLDKEVNGNVGVSFVQALSRQIRNYVTDNIEENTKALLRNMLLGENNKLQWQGLNIDWKLVGIETLAGVIGNKEIAEGIDAAYKMTRALKGLRMNFEEYSEMNYLFAVERRKSDSYYSIILFCNRCCNRRTWNRRNKFFAV